MNNLACKISEDNEKCHLYFLQHKFMYSNRLLCYHSTNNPDLSIISHLSYEKCQFCWLIVWSGDRNNESGRKIVAEIWQRDDSDLTSSSQSCWDSFQQRHQWLFPHCCHFMAFFYLFSFMRKSNSLRVLQVSSPAIETWCQVSLSVSMQGRVTSASAPPTTAAFASGIQTTRFS